jgi:hypothetical protein
MNILRTGPLTAEEHDAVIEGIGNMPDGFGKDLLTRLLEVGYFWRSAVKNFPHHSMNGDCLWAGGDAVRRESHCTPENCPWKLANES